MQITRSILALFYKEYKLSFKNIYDLLTIILFFILGLFIFVFSVGADREILNKIGIGIVWTLLLLSTNLSINKFFKEDFEDGNLFLLYMNGISFELIVLIKLICFWVFLQIPFIVFIPIALLMMEIFDQKISLILITFLIGSPVLTCLAAISGSMNLLNNKNFAMGSIIIMILSIPFIIFSVGIITAGSEVLMPQLSILTGILFIFLSITPWACGSCIKLAIRNKK